MMEKNGVKIGILSYCDLDTCHKKWIDGNLDAGPALLKVGNVVKEINSLRRTVCYKKS